MGHVGRSIPILEQLMNQGNTVIIACNDDQRLFYKCYFKNIDFIDHSGYPFAFKPSGFSKTTFLATLPKLIVRHFKELGVTRKWVKEHKIDYVISDQRYGFRSHLCHSVLITHQVSLPLPWYCFPVQVLNTYLLKRFDSCWVVDDAFHSFAGKLSKTNRKSAQYIGIQSRFKSMSQTEKKNQEILLLNGPKEFHSLLIASLLAKNPHIETIIGDAKNISDKHCIPSNDWLAIDHALLSAKKIYSFCGYSTMMDVSFLGCEWECIPTPGQWEQEYLYSLKTKKPQ